MITCTETAATMQVPAILATGGWRLGIGDPTISGWVVVVCYFAGAAACAWALHVARIGAKMAGEHQGPERRSGDRANAYRASVLFWALLIVLFSFLGLNEQIDLQTWLTELGRRVALAQGWYEQRGAIQELVVAAIAVGGLVMLVVLLYLTRDLLPRHVLAFVGMVLLACYVLAQSLSFHPLDDVLGAQLLGIKVRWLLELVGIFCVGSCALMNSRWYQLKPATHPDERPSAAPVH